MSHRRPIYLIGGLEYKECTRCHSILPMDDFGNDDQNWTGYVNWCRDCSADRLKEWQYKIRLEIITHYGGQCVCCGESEFAFLAIDHINGGGNQWRKTLTRSYMTIIRDTWPDDLQILCHNCNYAKGQYGQCPHEVGLKVVV